MNDDQRTALKVWLGSATYDNEFRPLSMEALAKVLKDDHEIATSSSALGRWKKKYAWDDTLEVQISTALLKNEEVREMLDKSVVAEGAEKIFDDFRANEAIKNKSYSLVDRQLDYYEKQMQLHHSLSEKDIKMVTELLKLTSDREDKLLDRQAMLSAAKLLNSADVLASIGSQDIDVEEAIEVEVDE